MSKHSTRKPRPRKPADRPDKPYPDFPLYAHPLGYWSKKVAGVIRHYGRWGRVVNGVLTPVPYEAGWQEARCSTRRSSTITSWGGNRE